MSGSEAREAPIEARFSKEEERYLVHSSAEIAQVLRATAARSALMTATFGEAGALALTTLLEVDPGADRLLFDMPAQKNLAARLASGATVTFTTSLDGIRIKFRVDGLWATGEPGREVLAGRLPEAVLRLQRREFFRVACPMSNPPKCTIPYETGSGKLRAIFEVADLSVGGVALLARAPAIAFEVGNVHPDCTIVLPGEGALATGLEVRNVRELELKSGKMTRVGCRFVRPRPEGITRLQRYAMKLERERNLRFGKD
ncbi:MAG: flagellar brake protein [Burkholderiales bacterium]|nr:flagellar brake protein [Burkholderiales bacterium]